MLFIFLCCLFGFLAIVYRKNISVFGSFLGEAAIDLAKSYNSVYLEENEEGRNTCKDS
jgi:hypothetical protein